MSELKGAKMEGSKVPAEEIKNPNLVAAIEKMQDDNTTENINKMIDEVMKAKFILPAKVTPKTEAKTTNGQTVMQQSTQVQFRLLENGNKEKFFGVFTDTDELFKWKDTQNAQKVVTDFDSIAQMVMDPQADVKGFVINPFGKSVTFPKQMVHSFKQQKDYMKLKNQTIEPGSPISLGEPKEYPIDLMAALINHFSTEPTVNAAYLRLIEQNGQKSYFIVVDFFGDIQIARNGQTGRAGADDSDLIVLLGSGHWMEYARLPIRFSMMKSSFQ